MKFLSALLLLLMLVAGVWSVYQINRPNDIREETSVVLEKGENVRLIAERLEKAGIIPSSFIFRLLVRLQGIDKRLKAGEYVFAPRMNMFYVSQKLLQGDIFYRKITLPEGLSSHKIKELILSEPALSGNITIPMPEGSILPDTYVFSKGESRDNIVRQAQKAMSDFLAKAWDDNQSPILKNEKELLILASIVEKETGLNDERFDVSAVFNNRLRLGMMLQTDPSVIYAITGGKADLGRALLKKDLEFDSPFNTYRNYGLPPEPICNPGKEAIKAAAHPSDKGYLFFVANGEGGHRFANNLNEHNENVARYRKLKKN
ncbi:MAG: endolytic transglycosylase MltG [Alphaproteobacteria bacterium]|nr:endolytic transglycosylase MltG [Alphaproteobacteria bacterium]